MPSIPPAPAPERPHAPASPSPVGPEHAAKEVAWLAALVDSTEDAIYAKDLDGTIMAWNAAAVRLYGYTPTEAVGRPIAMLVPTEARDEYDEFMERVRRGERISELETVRLRKDGSRVQVSLTVSPIRDSTGGLVGASVIVRDLSERKRRESEIAKGRARLRAILDTAVDAIITIDGRGLIQTINPATERMFGYATAELIGQNVEVLMPAPFHAEHDGYISRYKQTGEKPIIGIGREVQARRKDGTVFPIDLAVSEVEPGVLFTGVIRDLSERKTMEANLRQADRLATIGAVAGGLGHDINNLLFTLRMGTDVLGRCPLSPDGAAAVQSLRNVTGYLRDLSRGLHLVALDPECRGDGTSKRTCLEEWPPGTTALLKTMSGRGIGVELEIPAGLPDVHIAPHQLTQIVFNLVGNAVSAIKDAPRPDGGVVRVSACLRPGESRVRFQVADNGCGMSKEVLARAFEPFFTTRAGRGGTGVGLALVKRLVTEAGGEVSIESKPGTGTTVTVDLCAAPEVAVVPEAAADSPGAMVSIADARAAALVRGLLARMGLVVRSNSDPDGARVWVVDPAAVEVKQVERWAADRAQQRRVVLFGKPPLNLRPPGKRSSRWSSRTRTTTRACVRRSSVRWPPCEEGGAGAGPVPPLRCRRAHGDIHSAAPAASRHIAMREPGVGREDLLPHRHRRRCSGDPLADAGRTLRQRPRVRHVQPVELSVHPFLDSRLTQVQTERLGGDGEPVGHPHAQRRQFADHLAQRSVLAADNCDIVDGDRRESDHEWSRICGARSLDVAGNHSKGSVRDVIHVGDSSEIDSGGMVIQT